MFATARSRDTINDLELLGIETLDLVVNNEQSVMQCYSEVYKRVGDEGLDFLINNASVHFHFLSYIEYLKG